MTPLEGAQWMLDELKREGVLYQESAVCDLANMDSSLITFNDAGNVAISREVLRLFNKIAPTSGYVWSRSERYWRPREEGDEPGRSQY